MGPSTQNAEALCKALREYGLPTMQSAQITQTDGGETRVRVVLSDGFTFSLPHDFNVEHFDVLIAIIASAKLFGSDRALLELNSPGREN